MTRDELLPILKHVAKFVAGRQSKAAMWQQLCFRDNLVYGYNGETGIIRGCPLGIRGSVPAERLVSLISRMPNEEIKIAMKGNNFRIQCAGNNANLPTAPAEKYPDFLPAQYTDSPCPDNLQEAVKTVARVVDDKAGISKNFGVALHDKYVYSTDGLRATRYNLNGSVGTGTFFISPKSAKTLTSLPSPHTLMQWDNVFGLLFEPKGFWCSTVLSAKFPIKMVDDCVSRPQKDVVELPENITAVMSRMQVMTDELDRYVELEAKHGELCLSSSIREGGDVNESLAWNVPAEFKICVNPQHFIEATQLTRRIDLIQLHEDNRLHFVGDGFDHILTLVV
jgi:DNA polymerase III sliding clamp (beta) subunit (PCNA family)